MNIQELFPLLHQLSRADKLRVLQYVVNELAAEEGLAPMYTPTHHATEPPLGAGKVAPKVHKLSEEEEQREALNPT